MGDSWGSFGSWDSWWSGYGSDSWGSYDSWDGWGSYGSWDSYGPSYWSSYGPSYWSSGSYGSGSWDMWGSGSPSYWSSSAEDSAWFRHGAEKRSLAANMKHGGKTNMAEKQTGANDIDASELIQQLNNYLGPWAGLGNPWGIHKKGKAAEVKEEDKDEATNKETAHFREMSKKVFEHAMELKRTGAVKDNKAALKVAALNWLTLHPFNGVPQAQLNWGRAQRKNKAEAALKKKNLKAKLGAGKHKAEARKHQAEARKHQTEAKKHQARSA